MKERALFVDYLRSFIILTVVVFHATLSYPGYAKINIDAYILSTHPIVDARRWIGFDTVVYFHDIFFMSLMFLISGFFVVSSLERKGSRQYISDRFRRLFVPFIFAVTLLAFLTYYPSYVNAREDYNILRFLADFFTDEYWPPGPAWFLWVLYIFNLVFIWIYPSVKPHLQRLGNSFLTLFDKPALLILFWFLVSWVLYIPFRLLFGPDQWIGLGPFDFQISRLLLYFGYFMIGTIAGTIPFEKGLLSGKSVFMRAWPVFIVLSLSTFILLLNIDKPLERLVQSGIISSFSSNLVYSSIFTASCVFSCAAYLTTARAIFTKKNRFWDIVNSNAFVIYVIHYTFIIWGQYFLLNLNMSAIVKFLIVALSSLVLSFLSSHFLRKISMIKNYL